MQEFDFRGGAEKLRRRTEEYIMGMGASLKGAFGPSVGGRLFDLYLAGMAGAEEAEENGEEWEAQALAAFVEGILAALLVTVQEGGDHWDTIENSLKQALGGEEEES